MGELEKESHEEEEEEPILISAEQPCSLRYVQSTVAKIQRLRLLGHRWWRGQKKERGLTL